MADPSEPFELPVDGTLDLHTFAPRDVRAVLLDYLEAAHGKGLREIRIIHGQGIGVQRAIVQATLDRHPLVVEFQDEWHLGATVARLAP
ncbi:MAG TPA: Smr/MutS family protein [Vicinamibacterales bacterium]|nr:Smr/MutS family protein [Vicinamibacterales bacterium]